MKGLHCVLHSQAQDINLAMLSPAGTQDAVTQQLVNAVGSGDVTRNLQAAGYGVNSVQITSINGQPYTPSGTASDNFIIERSCSNAPHQTTFLGVA